MTIQPHQFSQILEKEHLKSHKYVNYMKETDLETWILVQSKGTKTFALFSTKTFDHREVIGKSSKGVSVSVVTLSFPTLKLSKSALKYVPAAPEFLGQPILKPPETKKEKKKIHCRESHLSKSNTYKLQVRSKQSRLFPFYI